MQARYLLAAALMLAACTPAAPTSPTTTSGSSAPSAAAPSALPSVAAPTPVAPEDFNPTKLTLSIDGQAVPIPQKGYTGSRDNRSAGVTIGLFKKEKGTGEDFRSLALTVSTKGKALSAPDFTTADAGTTVLGMNWLKGASVQSYTADTAGTWKLSTTGGKLNVTYSGKMSRAAGASAFPLSVMVELTVEGIPVTN